MLRHLILVSLALVLGIESSDILSKTIYADGKREFHVVKMIKGNKCDCQCSCMPPQKKSVLSTTMEPKLSLPFPVEKKTSPDSQEFEQTATSARDLTAKTEDKINRKTIDESQFSIDSPQHQEKVEKDERVETLFPANATKTTHMMDNYSEKMKRILAGIKSVVDEKKKTTVLSKSNEQTKTSTEEVEETKRLSSTTTLKITSTMPKTTTIEKSTKAITTSSTQSPTTSSTTTKLTSATSLPSSTLTEVDQPSPPSEIPHEKITSKPFTKSPISVKPKTKSSTSKPVVTTHKLTTTNKQLKSTSTESTTVKEVTSTAAHSITNKLETEKQTRQSTHSTSKPFEAPKTTKIITSPSTKLPTTASPKIEPAVQSTTEAKTTATSTTAPQTSHHDIPLSTTISESSSFSTITADPSTNAVSQIKEVSSTSETTERPKTTSSVEIAEKSELTSKEKESEQPKPKTVDKIEEKIEQQPSFIQEVPPEKITQKEAKVLDAIIEDMKLDEPEKPHNKTEEVKKEKAKNTDVLIVTKDTTNETVIEKLPPSRTTVSSKIDETTAISRLLKTTTVLPLNLTTTVAKAEKYRDAIEKLKARLIEIVRNKQKLKAEMAEKEKILELRKEERLKKLKEEESKSSTSTITIESTTDRTETSSSLPATSTIKSEKHTKISESENISTKKQEQENEVTTSNTSITPTSAPETSAPPSTIPSTTSSSATPTSEVSIHQQATSEASTTLAKKVSRKEEDEDSQEESFQTAKTTEFYEEITTPQHKTPMRSGELLRATTPAIHISNTSELPAFVIAQENAKSQTKSYQNTQMSPNEDIAVDPITELVKGIIQAAGKELTGMKPAAVQSLYTDPNQHRFSTADVPMRWKPSMHQEKKGGEDRDMLALVGKDIRRTQPKAKIPVVQGKQPLILDAEDIEIQRELQKERLLREGLEKRKKTLEEMLKKLREAEKLEMERMQREKEEEERKRIAEESEKEVDMESLTSSQEQEQVTTSQSSLIDESQGAPPKIRYRLRPSQCNAINKFTRLFNIADPSEWIQKNCNFAKRYFPKASCTQIEALISSCFVFI